MHFVFDLNTLYLSGYFRYVKVYGRYCLIYISVNDLRYIFLLLNVLWFCYLDVTFE